MKKWKNRLDYIKNQALILIKMIYILHGENSYESWREYEKLKKEFKKKNKGGKIEVIDGNEAFNTDFNASAMSLFAEKKLLIIKRLLTDKDLISVANQDKFEQLFNDIINSESEILIWEEKKLDKRKKIFKNLDKKAVVREFKNFSMWGNQGELKSWIRNYARNIQLEMDTDVLAFIIFRYENNQWLIASELDKLKFLLKSENTNRITKEHIEYFSVVQIDKFFYFIDVFFEKNKKAALNYINSLMFDTGDEFKLLGGLRSSLRDLYLLKKYPEKGYNILQSKFNVKSFRLNKLSGYARCFSEIRLHQLYSQLTNLDYMFKTGQMDPKIGLTLLIASL